MSRRAVWKMMMFSGAFGACIAASTVRAAYPEWENLQPLLAYVAGFMMAIALFVEPPQTLIAGQSTQVRE